MIKEGWLFWLFFISLLGLILGWFISIAFLGCRLNHNQNIIPIWCNQNLILLGPWNTNMSLKSPYNRLKMDLILRNVRSLLVSMLRIMLRACKDSPDYKYLFHPVMTCLVMPDMRAVYWTVWDESIVVFTAIPFSWIMIIKWMEINFSIYFRVDDNSPQHSWMLSQPLQRLLQLMTLVLILVGRHCVGFPNSRLYSGFILHKTLAGQF